MWTAAIVGDLQAPYHDPRAVSVMCQVLSEMNLDLLIFNGDFVDFRNLALYPVINPTEKTVSSLKYEVLSARVLLAEICAAVPAKHRRWHDGNHEWRALRTLTRDPKVIQLLEISEVQDALATPKLMKLDDFGIDYVGKYPKGSWLHPQLDPHKNVWVEHGYKVCKKSGYTVSSLIMERMASCITNHVERLAGPVWTRALGRDFFGIENGNLSIIGEPELGEDIYGGVPFAEPAYLNHRQGFTLIHWDGQDWYPFTIRIKDGRTICNGKVYRA